MDLPTLPTIDNNVDLLLDVFTHKSLKPDGAPLNDEYGNEERLAELGKSILSLVITHVLFHKEPLLGAGELVIQRESIMSNQNIEEWVNSYALKIKIRRGNDVELTTEESARFFHTYVGAIYFQHGIDTVQRWISQLVDPTAEPPPPAPTAVPPTQPAWSQPPAPSSPPPTIPPPPAYPLQTTNDALKFVTLSLVNQTAAQRGVKIEYSAKSDGPAHQPLWSVSCFIDGVEKGRGQGKNQKSAKEEAARQTWMNMGW